MMADFFRYMKILHNYFANKNKISYLGLQVWVNMRPYSNQPYQPIAIPYTVGVTRKNDYMDQVTTVMKVKPGHHISIYVLPKVISSSSKFNSLSLETRRCKLEEENTDFKFITKYSRRGCEFECAVRKASDFCKCRPWNYPNDFLNPPTCDIFGAHCFDHSIYIYISGQ